MKLYLTNINLEYFKSLLTVIIKSLNDRKYKYFKGKNSPKD